MRPNHLESDFRKFNLDIDSTIILQKPKISSYVSEMKKNISAITQCQDISIKSTTTDYLGFVGKSKGICAISTILINLLF